MRSSAADALGRLKAKDQVPELVQLLKDSDDFVLRSAVGALGALQAKEQAPELIKLLKDADFLVSISVAEALGEMQAQDQIPELVKLLKDTKAGVRSSAADALGALKAKDKVSDLVQLLKDEDERVRNSAVAALGTFGPLPSSLLGPLSEAYYDSRHLQVEIRLFAYYLTGGDTSAQLVIHQIMFDHLHRGDPSVRLAFCNSTETVEM